ncbi:hypothetical protein U8335_26860 [Roseiconus lacunae]|uniref:hypothetical protein n=1 Tax=Roseiconus lacunae TaxID=2605694 RepID=UPI00308D720C|nr:hypothetical protein U8335_26860 [Stieleria sp. HD01]
MIKQVAIQLFVIGTFSLGSMTYVNRVAAHEGPPFPIIVDEPIGQWRVSVWTDPDIGDARFFVIVENSHGELPRTVPAVELWTQPVSKRLDRVSYHAKKQALRNRVQFFAKPTFDMRDFWTVGIRLIDSKGVAKQLTAEVESTPPGQGIWDLAIYLFPFLLIGGVWIFAMVRRMKQYREYAANRQDQSGIHQSDAHPRLEEKKCRVMVDDQMRIVGGTQ